MAIFLRRSDQRKHDSEEHGHRWNSFFPGDPSEPLVGGFRVLEAMVEHDLAPGMGFSVQAPKDREVVTYLHSGAMIHEDSSGRTGLLQAGEFGRMSTPHGTIHCAINPSWVDRTRLFECAIAPDRDHLSSGSQQKRFPLAERRGVLRLVVSPDGRQGSLRIRQNVQIYSALMERGTHLIHEFGKGRSGWLQVVTGRIRFDELILDAGDGFGVSDVPAVSFTAGESSEVLLIDLP